MIFSNAGKLSLETLGKLGFLPKTNWLGENPFTFFNEFLALTAQATAISKSHLVSSMVLATVKPRIALCLSTRPLL